MKKILHIQSSPRTDISVSRKIGQEVIGKIIEKYPNSTVNTKNLAENLPPHLEEKHINAFFTLPEQRSEAQKELVKYSDDTIRDFKESDIIVIESPMYNFNVPSTLKAYLDHMVRFGETFQRTENGPEGLIKDKKVYVVFSGGFVYSNGALIAFDHNTIFLKQLLGFMGMTDVKIILAEGLSAGGDPEQIIQNAIEGIVID